MVTDTEAIVLRQVKTMTSRRMIVLFSKKYGKISVGSSISEGGKNKSALITRPFTYGRYELFKGKDSYNLNSGQVLESFYGIGEDLDKYMQASYVLELTDRLIPDEVMQPRLFQALLDFLTALERRTKKVDTLVIAYMVKALDMLGVMPVINECAECGKTGCDRFFSVNSGGIICGECAKTLTENNPNSLIYDTNFGIINILRYFQKEPFSSFEKIALDDTIAVKLKEILKKYMEYHLDIGILKSEMLTVADPSANE